MGATRGHDWADRFGQVARFLLETFTSRETFLGTRPVS